MLRAIVDNFYFYAVNGRFINLGLRFCRGILSLTLSSTTGRHSYLARRNPDILLIMGDIISSLSILLKALLSVTVIRPDYMTRPR